MSLIVAENVKKDYRTGEVVVPAIRGVSFEIDPASFVSFIGPSGSGKTTLLNLIGCIDTPTSGRLTVAGIDTVALDRRQRAAFRGSTVGFIFQDFNLIPVLSARENIEYPLLMVSHIPPAERIREIGTMAAIGTPPGKILSLFMIEGLSLGILGTVLGGILGAIILFILNIANITYNFGQSKGLVLHVSINLTELAVISVIVILISVVATLEPAFKASRMKPIEALRHV